MNRPLRFLLSVAVLSGGSTLTLGQAQVAGVTGTFHMLRHFFVTALIQSGVNAKVAQTLCWPPLSEG